jgi:hypothetical protein
VRGTDGKEYKPEDYLTAFAGFSLNSSSRRNFRADENVKPPLRVFLMNATTRCPPLLKGTSISGVVTEEGQPRGPYPEIAHEEIKKHGVTAIEAKRARSRVPPGR